MGWKKKQTKKRYTWREGGCCTARTRRFAARRRWTDAPSLVAAFSVYETPAEMCNIFGYYIIHTRYLGTGDAIMTKPDYCYTNCYLRTRREVCHAEEILCAMTKGSYIFCRWKNGSYTHQFVVVENGETLDMNIYCLHFFSGIQRLIN